MKTQLYFVTLADSNYETIDKFLTDAAHLDQCVENAKRRAASVYVHSAVMCFDGYFAPGDFYGAV